MQNFKTAYNFLLEDRLKIRLNLTGFILVC